MSVTWESRSSGWRAKPAHLPSAVFKVAAYKSSEEAKARAWEYAKSDEDPPAKRKRGKTANTHVAEPVSKKFKLSENLKSGKCTEDDGTLASLLDTEEPKKTTKGPPSRVSAACGTETKTARGR